ncbi:MAG: YceD family protein, partial [Limisphaerales bacterium]
MSISLNLTLLSKKPQHLDGEVSFEDLGIDLKDELMRVAAPMQYDLSADWMDEAALVQGDVSLPVEYECVRCLQKFTRPVELEGYALHLPLKGEDAVEVVDDCVDLTPYLREDILIGLPQ